MRDQFNLAELAPDIVALILQRVIAMAPGFSQALAEQIEREVREQYGGQRVFVNKRGKNKTPEQREAIYKDALTNMPTPEILTKHKISISTLKRLVKTGGRFGP